MRPCYLCSNEREDYFGYFCPGCLKYQNLCQLYKPAVVHNLLEKALLINEGRIEAKVEKQMKSILDTKTK